VIHTRKGDPIILFIETYDLFSQPQNAQDLGMLDPAARAVEVTIAGHEYSILQSPGILQSDRQGGTTGAAVWQASIRLADWLCWTGNMLEGLLTRHNCRAMELGSGISGIIPCVLASRLERFVATDQAYLLKTLRENIDNNSGSDGAPGESSSKRLASGARSHNPTKHRPMRQPRDTRAPKNVQIDVLPLDWETDDVKGFMTAHDLGTGIDLLIASDCIYNYALIDPFVQTCTQICQQRQRQRSQDQHDAKVDASNDDSSISRLPTVLLVAQQMRQPDVFEQWLEATLLNFRVWRVPDELLTEGLRTGTGFALHLGILKD
jgi:hypothetical protein